MMRYGNKVELCGLVFECSGFATYRVSGHTCIIQPETMERILSLHKTLFSFKSFEEFSQWLKN